MAAPQNQFLISDPDLKTASFALGAEFVNDDTHWACCCEFREFVMFSQKENIPNYLPTTYQPNTWYEDVGQDGSHYGHRDERGEGQGNQYTKPPTESDPSQSCGAKYNGTDAPTLGLNHAVGSWSFKWKVIDRCNGDAKVAELPDEYALKIEW